MARKTFFSFHFAPDNWRVAQVRNAGVLEGNIPVSDNDWEAVVKKGDAAIETWIDNQLSGRTCTVVLIGASTAERKWVKHEIKKSWSDGKGVLGVHIHNLKDVSGTQCSKGANPFASFKVGETALSAIVKVYDPPFSSSTNVYSHIKDNLADWAEEAVKIRAKY